jgi:membrane protein
MVGAARKTGAVATLKRTASEFQEDNLTDWAAALTYYCSRCFRR